MILSLSDCYKIFTSDLLRIEVCQNTVLREIDIAMTTINKNSEIYKSRILRDVLDLILKIRHQELKMRCLANNLGEKKFCTFESN